MHMEDIRYITWSDYNLIFPMVVYPLNLPLKSKYIMSLTDIL